MQAKEEFKDMMTAEIRNFLLREDMAKKIPNDILFDMVNGCDVYLGTFFLVIEENVRIETQQENGIIRQCSA